MKGHIRQYNINGNIYETMSKYLTLVLKMGTQKLNKMIYNNFDHIQLMTKPEPDWNHWMVSSNQNSFLGSGQIACFLVIGL